MATHIAGTLDALPPECNRTAAGFRAWVGSFLNNIWRKCWLRGDDEISRFGVNLGILPYVKEQGDMAAGWVMIRWIKTIYNNPNQNSNMLLFLLFLTCSHSFHCSSNGSLALQYSLDVLVVQQDVPPVLQCSTNVSCYTCDSTGLLLFLLKTFISPSVFLRCSGHWL